MSIMVKCPSCSAELTEASKFCSECGGALEPAYDETVAHDGGPIDNRVHSPRSDSSHHGRFLPGTKVADRYRIVSLVGKGGMGEVYRADDLVLGHTVALKFLPNDLVNDSRQLEYFLSEVRLTRQISHPNICRVYDIGDVDGQRFLSMEYIDGEDLKALIRRIGRLPKGKGVEIAQQLCAGLAAAHEKGVLHRDLKPANIMIDGRGQARVTDFGLARVAEDADKREVSGTPSYMAPEQLALGETTIQSDLYSLGLVLYELFTGSPVYSNSSISDLRQAHAVAQICQDARGEQNGLMLDSDPVTLWINTLRGEANEAAADSLWRHFMDRLYKSAQKKLRRDTRRVYDEEDAALSAFHSVCIGIKDGRFPDLNDRNSLLSLLLVVTSRKVARRHEHDLRQRRDIRRNLSECIFIHSAHDSATADADHFRSREPTPEFAAEFADTCEALLQRLDDVKQQKILTLRLEGYTETEIADRLKVSSRTVHRKLEVIRRHCSHLEQL